MKKRTTKRIVKGLEVESRSSNIFADLGLRNAGKLKIKSGLVIEIKVKPPSRAAGHSMLANV